MTRIGLRSLFVLIYSAVICLPMTNGTNALAQESSVKDRPNSENTKATGKPTRDLIAEFPSWKEAIHLDGDADKGRQYFQSKILNTSLTCASCHSFDARDSMHSDGDGLRRAGFPIYASVYRTNIKNSGTDLAALGADVCVVHFMKGDKKGMSPQELANMDRFLHSGGKADHATSTNVDYANLKWTIPEKLDGGDIRRGEALVTTTCITCHAVGGKGARVLDASTPLARGSFTSADLKSLALRIRNPDYKNNDEMPGYSDLRLSNQELIDILSWLTTK